MANSSEINFMRGGARFVVIHELGVSNEWTPKLLLFVRGIVGKETPFHSCDLPRPTQNTTSVHWK